MGNESMNIVSSVYANKWFKGKELAFALALGMGVGRLGSTSNNFLMPVVADNVSLGFALLVGLIFLIISFIMGYFLNKIEEQAQEYEPRQQNQDSSGENVD